MMMMTAVMLYVCIYHYYSSQTLQKDARRMTLDQTKSFSGAFLAEACGIVEELDGLAANMTSSPLASPERQVSPDRRMTLGPDMDLLGGFFIWLI